MLLLPDKQVLWWRESGARLGYRNKSQLSEHGMTRLDSLVKCFTGTNSGKQGEYSLDWIEREQGSLFCIAVSWTQELSVFTAVQKNCP